MAVTKTINIDGKDVTFKASAAIPRLYRAKFGRDIYSDLDSIQASVNASDPAASSISPAALELFEDFAYIFCKHTNPEDTPDSVEEWLEQFDTFSVYQVMPEIVELWGLNTQTTVEPKKSQRTEREMTTPLFMLRCVQMGISIRDLDLLTIGMVNEMFIENSNDDYDYQVVATQEQFDRF